MAGFEFRLISTGVGLSLKQPKPFDRAVDPGEDIAKVFQDIARQATGKKIARLLIVSHAYDDGGEFTVFLGSVGKKRGIRLADVGVFAPLAGKFESPLRGIEMQGCKVADNAGLSPLDKPKVGSGAALCQAIANKARTGVLASTDAQPTQCQEEVTSVTERDKHGLPATRVIDRKVLDCEDVWSGNLWIFTPGKIGATTPPP